MNSNNIIGSTIGSKMLEPKHYKVLEKIGSGGQAIVYKGIDEDTKTFVAIKMLYLRNSDSAKDAIQRFLREGRTLKDLHHKYVVEVFATFEEDDQHYIVMEYIDASLKGSIDGFRSINQKLPIDQVIKIALAVAHALEYLHDHARKIVIHRDIKPSNILLDKGVPKLADFGLVYLVAEKSWTHLNARPFMGTDEYLAPEACAACLDKEKRAAFNADVSGDIWSFGLVIYEMLIGQPLFATEGIRDIAAFNLLMKEIIEKPIPDVRPLRQDMPPQLADLLEMMLEKDPTRRISNCGEIKAILNGISIPDTSKPVAPPTPSTILRENDPEHQRRTERRYTKIGLALAALAFVSASIIAIFSLLAQNEELGIQKSLIAQAATEQAETIIAQDTAITQITDFFENTQAAQAQTATEQAIIIATQNAVIAQITADAANTQTAQTLPAAATTLIYPTTPAPTPIPTSLPPTTEAPSASPTKTITGVPSIATIEAPWGAMQVNLVTISECSAVDGGQTQCTDLLRIGALVVTEEQYDQCERFGTCITNHIPIDTAHPGQPAANVTWDMAYDYCRALEAELPTDPEWETVRLYVLDMGGQVREWTSSPWNAPNQEKTAFGATEEVVIRGNDLPLDGRGALQASVRAANVGFRCVF